MTLQTGSDAYVQDLDDRDVGDMNREQRPPIGLMLGHEVTEEEVDEDDI